MNSMQSNLRRVFRQYLVLIAVMSAAASVPAKEVTLPAETSALRESPLPGYSLAQQKCAICHSVDYISYQPPGMTLKQWTAEMTKMQHSYGAPISPEEIEQIGAYLAVAYGSAAIDDPDVAAIVSKASNVNASSSRRNSTADGSELQTLLAQNACTGCHAIDSKLVGPSFKMVATKYRDETDGLSAVMTSIKKGGSGKWGSIPMPAMPGLTEEELRTLAEYVLTQ
ncbi:c-type cytochrome [Congregibacter brevis]|uniref:Cytochrome c-551 n=1 Tax=Congregibacter brevis TaxID=3081201 RepID=A0ABZ0IAR7_9GAMM|nr:c-type cytochrome [Congregibacter sp. IMCC45268]